MTVAALNVMLVFRNNVKIPWAWNPLETKKILWLLCDTVSFVFLAAMSVRTFQLIDTMQLLIGTFERIQNVSHKDDFTKKYKKMRVPKKNQEI